MKLLPDSERQGDIQFVLAKKMPYMRRIKLIIALMAAGIIVQLLVHFLPGLIIIVCATLMSVIKGYHARPKLTSGGEKWKQVTPDEYNKVIKKQKELRKWDIDMFDITNPTGLGLFAGIAIVTLALYFYLEDSVSIRLARYLAIDMCAVFAPHWLTGTRTYLKKDKLILKIELLKQMMRVMEGPSDIQVLPMLSTKESKEGGCVPMDARLMCRALNAPEAFMGLQVQVSINNVQGHDYPYLYCVLIGKRGSGVLPPKAGLGKKLALIGLNYEFSTEKDVDVLVIRQRTTKDSGYHTDYKAARYVVEKSLEALRLIN